MIDSFTPSERKTATRYSLVFDDGHGNGLWFPCDEEGVVYCTNCGANIEITYSAPHWVKDPEREAKRTIAKLWNRRCPNEKILNEEQTQEAKEYIYGILLTAKPQVTTEELAEYLAEHGVTFRER